MDEAQVDELMCKILQNIEIMIAIKEKNREEAKKLAEELEKSLGIRVLLSAKNLDEYPALVINRSKHSDTIALLYTSRDTHITITYEYLDAEVNVLCWPYTSVRE